jgi:hypothetical protein
MTQGKVLIDLFRLICVLGKWPKNRLLVKVKPNSLKSQDFSNFPQPEGSGWPIYRHRFSGTSLPRPLPSE